MPIADIVRAAIARVARVARLARTVRAQSLVEFAILLPVLLLLLGGAIDLGRLFSAQVAISNAAKEGAFFGATSPGCDQERTGCSDPRTVAWHIEQEAKDLSPLSYTVQCLHDGSSVALSACVEDDLYRVSVSHTFSMVTPLLSGIFGSSLQLHATASAVVLNESFDPNATPYPMESTTPTPTPSAGFCVVPDLSGTKADNAAGTWSAAGFGGAVTKSGSGNFTIVDQSLAAGSSQLCTSGITIYKTAPSSTPSPTPTPTPASPSATPTVTPSPTPTPSCRTVPDLVGMKVKDARTAWTAAGFTGSFSPSSGSTYKIVTNQVTNPGSAPGQCIAPTATVTVTHS